MNEGHKSEPTRRQFFLAALRAAALGGLVGGGIFLLSKRHNGAADDGCINNWDCRGCPVLHNCPVSGHPPPDRSAGRPQGG